MKLAIVHDYLNQYGGAERLIEIFHEMYPDAPIYTSLFEPDFMPPIFQEMDVRVSFLQKMPFTKKHFKKYLLLFPTAFESFDLNEYDVILSCTTAWTKGVITSPDCIHICYCNTPMRFAWKYHDYVKRENLNFLFRATLPFVITPLRMWDITTANNVDYFIANSHNVARRIAKFYRREAEVIHCPTDCSKYYVSENTDGYFLIVSRLREYKRIDIAVEAFNQLGLPLKIIGTGSDEKKLKKLAKSNIEFLGRVSDAELREYYSKCQALIFPGEEDFGLTPLEAQASGRPVIAYGAGGVLETVIDGITGVFFDKQTPEALMSAIRAFDASQFEPEKIRNHALEFDVSIFKERIKNFIEAKVINHKSVGLARL